MDSVYRYSTYRVIKRESVAEHVSQLMVFAALIGAELEDKGIEVDWRQVLYHGVFHDMGEVITGDMNGPFKGTLDDEERSHVHGIESQALQECLLASGVDERILKGTYLFLTQTCCPLVELCDALCVLSYLLQEKFSGNTLLIERVHDVSQVFRLMWVRPEFETLKPYISEAIRIATTEVVL